jgi:hypothetical protein
MCGLRMWVGYDWAHTPVAVLTAMLIPRPPLTVSTMMARAIFLALPGARTPGGLTVELHVKLILALH